MTTATITTNTTAEGLAALVASATHAGATHARVLKTGGKRAGIVPLAELDATYRGVDATVTFGTKRDGLPFEPLALPESKISLSPTPQKVAGVQVGEKSSSNRPAGTGFMAMIDKFLLDVDEKAGIINGFPRSKHSAAEVHAIVFKAFPQKDSTSVMKIIKVRPRHLEKQKGGLGFDDVKNPAPRWRFVGPGKTYDSPERLVTEMIKAKKKDAEILVRVGRLFPSCTKINALFLASARTALAKTERVKLPADQVRKAKEEARARVAKKTTNKSS